MRVRERLSRATRRDSGSAPVEFVLVGSLVVFLFLGVLQVGLLLHMRNVVVSSASEAVHAAARADGSCRAGVARFEQLMSDTLSEAVSAGVRRPITCGDDQARSGIVQLHVDVDLPLVFLPFGTVSVSATAHAVKEGR